MKCYHSMYDRDAAFGPGGDCPLCLEDENERLREALEVIAGQPELNPSADGYEWWDEAHWVAMRALQGEECPVERVDPKPIYPNPEAKSLRECGLDATIAGGGVMSVYKCDVCDNWVDDDYHPMVLGKKFTYYCPTCAEALQLDEDGNYVGGDNEEPASDTD